MKLFEVYIPNINKTIIYKIGSNANDNFNIIDQSKSNDIWFHLADYPSAHIIAVIPSEDIDKKDLKYIIKRGAVICKENSKYQNEKNLEITYTEISNISKTNIAGTVNVSKSKKIKI